MARIGGGGGFDPRVGGAGDPYADPLLGGNPEADMIAAPPGARLRNEDAWRAHGATDYVSGALRGAPAAEEPELAGFVMGLDKVGTAAVEAAGKLTPAKIESGDPLQLVKGIKDGDAVI